MKRFKEFLVFFASKIIEKLGSIEEVGSFIFIKGIKYYISDVSDNSIIGLEEKDKIKLTLETEEGIYRRIGKEYEAFNLKDCECELSYNIRQRNKIKKLFEEFKKSPIDINKKSEFYTRYRQYQRSIKEFNEDIKELQKDRRYYNMRKKYGIGLYPIKLFIILLISILPFIGWKVKILSIVIGYILITIYDRYIDERI